MKTQYRRNKRKMRGYRLHDARIAHSGGTKSIRSIKYELKDPDGVVGVRDAVADAIISDNTWLYGNINLNDYLRWRAGVSDEAVQNGEREYSLLGFWLKALALGFGFTKQTHAMADLSPEFNEQAFERIDDDIKQHLDKDKWLDFVKRGTSKKSDAHALREQIFNLVKTQTKTPRNDSKKSAGSIPPCITAIADIYCGKSKNDKFGIFGIVRPADDTFPKYKNRNISWFCEPRFPDTIDDQDIAQRLEKIVDYYNKKFGITKSQIGDATSKRLGLFEQSGTISLFLGNFYQFIRAGEFDEHVASVRAYFDLSDADSTSLRNKLQILHEYACHIPKKPLLVADWSAYNKFFGGTIDSWFSNRSTNRDKALRQFFGKEKADEATGEIIAEEVGIETTLQKIAEALPQDCDVKDGILQETLTYIQSVHGAQGVDTTYPATLTKAFVDELNGYYVPTLCDDLNAWVQKHQVEAGKLPAYWHKSLKKRIQSMPLFFGEHKRQQWEQLYNLKQHINDGVAKLQTVLAEGLHTSVLNDTDMTDAQVDMLAALYNRIKDDGNPAVMARLEAIQHALGVRFVDKTHRAKFYISGYERRQYTQLPIQHRLSVIELLRYAKLDELYELVTTAPQQDNSLRDTVQLSKVVLSAVVAGAGRDKQREVVLIHSTLQGYSAQLSKQQFIARYSAQATNGSQCVFAVGDGLTSTKGKKGAVKQGRTLDRYYYAFPTIPRTNTLETVPLKQVLPVNAHLPSDLRQPKAPYVSLRVFSSRYQVQFLDWFVDTYRHTNKKTTLDILGAFSIAEKELELDWRDDHPLVGEQPTQRVYVSQPFKLVPPKASKPHDSTTQTSKQGTFIGVDIGEYGLAWSLIMCDENRDDSPKRRRIVQLDSGFIADPQQRMLTKAVNDWRKKHQGRQTFNTQNTYVARLRESLIGSYRNQLEALAMHKDAQLVFEYQVSGFESGGKRLSKVYDSIKRGDVRNKANESQNTQAWGDVKKEALHKWASEITAAGTSQTCTKCKRWASLAIDQSTDKTRTKYTLEVYDDELFKVHLSDGEVRLLGKRGMKPGDTISDKDLKLCIKLAMRPNMHYQKGADGKDDILLPTPSLGLRIVKRRCDELGGIDGYDWERITQDFGQSSDRSSDKKGAPITRKYGNSAIFVCPYVDCLHIAHADMQAAYNIAIRGYLREYEQRSLPKNAPKKGRFSKDKFAGWQQELKYAPIGLGAPDGDG